MAARIGDFGSDDYIVWFGEGGCAEGCRAQCAVVAAGVDEWGGWGEGAAPCFDWTVEN